MSDEKKMIVVAVRNVKTKSCTMYQFFTAQAAREFEENTKKQYGDLVETAISVPKDSKDLLR